MFRSNVPPSGLPEEWKPAQLADIATVHGGGRLKLNKSHYVKAGARAYSAAGADGYVEQVEGTAPSIVLSSIGARCGKAFLTDGPWTTLANTQVITPDPSLASAKFLHAILNDESYWNRSGSAQPFIKPSDVKGAWVPLPPLDEQWRLAEVLEAMDRAVAGNRAVMEKASETLATLSDELLVNDAHQMGDPIRLGDLIDTLEAGVSVNSEARTAALDEIGILKTSCVSEGRFDPAQHKTVLETERSRVRVPVRGGSIIISRMNTFELVGANAFVATDHANLYLPDRLWLLKTNPRVHVRWLAYFMKTAKFREQVVSIATGTSGSMKNISKGRLNDLIVYIPDDQKQADDIDALAAVEEVLVGTRQIEAKQRVAASDVKMHLLSGRVRVPA